MYLIKAITDYWWLVVLRGLLGVGLGLAAIAMPLKTVGLLVLIVGLFLILDGAINITVALLSVRKNEHWWVLLLQGLIGLLIGLAVFSWPEATTKLILFLLAIWLLVMGISLLVTALLTRKENYGGWFLVVGGLLSLLFAMVLMSNPAQTVAAITMIVGVVVFVSGMMTTAFGLELRALRSDIKKVESA